MKQKGKKKNELKEMRTTSETSGTMLNAPIFESEESQKKKTKRRSCVCVCVCVHGKIHITKMLPF